MSLVSQLIRFFKEDQTKPIIERLDVNHTGEASQLILSEQHYFRLRMVEMFIGRRRWLGRSFFPAMQGMVSATYGSDEVELPSVADTSKLFDGQSGGDIAVRNFSLTPLLPYRGGRVELLCGLFGMQGEDYIAKVIKVLSSFGGLLAVPQLTSALSIAGPLAAGVQDLFAADGRLHLGYHDGWVGAGAGQDPPDNAFRSGYIAVIRADDNEVDRRLLRVQNQQLLIVRDGQMVPFTDKDHMLIHVEAREERDDLARLTSFYDPFNEALRALGKGNEEEAKTLMRTSLATARVSPDLTDADRSRVTQRLKELYLEAKTDIDIFGAVDDHRAMTARLRPTIPVGAAVDAGVPSLEELWEGL